MSPVSHQGERAADERLRRDVQHARAVAGAAHPGVGDPHHVPHPARSSFFGIGSCPHSGIPGAPCGPAFFNTSTEFSSTIEVGIVDPGGHVVVVLEHHRRPGMLVQLRVRPPEV